MALTYEIVKQIQRPWGPEVYFNVLNDGELIETGMVRLPKSVTISQEKINSRCQRKMQKIYNNYQYRYNRAELDKIIPEEYRPALVWLVTNIRQYPNATVIQAKTLWNDEMADEIFDFEKLVIYLQRLADMNFTWDQFKTYCINKTFEGVDD